MAAVPPDVPPIPPPIPPSAGPDTGRHGPPWEGAGEMFTRYLDTAMGVASDPSKFFATMRLDGGLEKPLFYALIGVVATGIISAVVGMLLPFISAAFFANIIVIPAVMAVMLFIGSGIYHLILTMLGGAKQTFEATFRVTAYALGTTIWANVVPVCGGFVGSIWMLVCLVIGFQRSHGVSTGMAVATVLIPVVVCGGFFGLLLMLGVGAAIMGGVMSGAFQ